MGNPYLLTFATQAAHCLVMAGGVFLVTWALRLRPGSWKIENPGRSALVALVVVAMTLIALTVYFSFNGSDIATSSTPLPVDLRFNASRVIRRMLIIGLFVVAPVLVVIRIRREPWSSTGFSSNNLWRSIVVGLLLSALVLSSSGPSVSERLRDLSTDHIWGLGYASIIGFNEEFLFRGYLQIRMMSWLGRWKGWVVASLVMALIHIGPRMLEQGMGPLDALASAATLIPVSLFLGFVMIRTGNVVASGLFHTVAGWAEILR